MAQFNITCVTDRYEPNVYYPYTNTIYIENVNVYTPLDGFIGQTDNKGVFKMKSTDQYHIEHGIDVYLERGGYVGKWVNIHSGTNRVIMENNGELANGSSLSDVFDEFSNFSTNRRNVPYSSLGTNITSAFCIYYRPGYPNNLDENRFLRVGDYVRRKIDDSQLPPSQEPFEPDVPPTIGPNTDPADYPNMFQYVSQNDGIHIIVKQTVESNYDLNYGVTSEMWYVIKLKPSQPSYYYNKQVYDSNNGTWVGPFTGNVVSPTGKLLFYNREYFTSQAFSAMGNTATLELPPCDIYKTTQSRALMLPRVTLINVSDIINMNITTDVKNQLIYERALAKLQMGGYCIFPSSIYPDYDTFVPPSRISWRFDNVTNNIENYWIADYGGTDAIVGNDNYSIIQFRNNFNNIYNQMLTSFNSVGNHWISVNCSGFTGSKNIVKWDGMKYTEYNLTPDDVYVYVFIPEALIEYTYNAQNSGNENRIIITEGSTASMTDAYVHGKITQEHYLKYGYLHVKFYNQT